MTREQIIDECWELAKRDANEIHENPMYGTEITIYEEEFRGLMEKLAIIVRRETLKGN